MGSNASKNKQTNGSKTNGRAPRHAHFEQPNQGANNHVRNDLFSTDVFRPSTQTASGSKDDTSVKQRNKPKPATKPVNQAENERPSDAERSTVEASRPIPIQRDADLFLEGDIWNGPARTRPAQQSLENSQNRPPPYEAVQRQPPRHIPSQHQGQMAPRIYPRPIPSINQYDVSPRQYPQPIPSINQYDVSPRQYPRHIPPQNYPGTFPRQNQRPIPLQYHPGGGLQRQQRPVQYQYQPGPQNLPFPHPTQYQPIDIEALDSSRRVAVPLQQQNQAKQTQSPNQRPEVDYTIESLLTSSRVLDDESDVSQKEVASNHPQVPKLVESEDDDDYIGANLRFYRNEIKFRPNGEYIEHIHKHWFGDYTRLEEIQTYIQWLFPLPERSKVNRNALPLQTHEAKHIYNDSETRTRFVTSYKLMLDFFGMELADEKTGEIRRTHLWKARFNSINRSNRNSVRLTRIMKSLAALGFANYQAPLLIFLLHEVLETRELSGIPRETVRHWIRSIEDEFDRLYVEELFRPRINEPSKQHKHRIPYDMSASQKYQKRKMYSQT